MKKREWTKVFLILYGVLAAAGVTVLFLCKSRGYPCRQMASAFGYLLLCLAGIYIGCLGISNLIRYKVRYPDKKYCRRFYAAAFLRHCGRDGFGIYHSRKSRAAESSDRDFQCGALGRRGQEFHTGRRETERRAEAGGAL